MVAWVPNVVEAPRKRSSGRDRADGRARHANHPGREGEQMAASRAGLLNVQKGITLSNIPEWEIIAIFPHVLGLCAS